MHNADRIARRECFEQRVIEQLILTPSALGPLAQSERQRPPSSRGSAQRHSATCRVHTKVGKPRIKMSAKPIVAVLSLMVIECLQIAGPTGRIDPVDARFINQEAPQVPSNVLTAAAGSAV